MGTGDPLQSLPSSTYLSAPSRKTLTQFLRQSQLVWHRRKLLSPRQPGVDEGSRDYPGLITSSSEGATCPPRLVAMGELRSEGPGDPCPLGGSIFLGGDPSTSPGHPCAAPASATTTQSVSFSFSPRGLVLSLQIPGSGAKGSTGEHRNTAAALRKGDPGNPAMLWGRNPRQVALGTDVSKEFTNLPGLFLGAPGSGHSTATVSP